MPNRLAGNEIHHSPHLAETVISALNLAPGPDNEMQLRLAKIQTADSHEELLKAWHYVQGIVRGLLIARVMTADQAVQVEAILHAAWRKRVEQLR